MGRISRLAAMLALLSLWGVILLAQLRADDPIFGVPGTPLIAVDKIIAGSAASIVNHRWFDSTYKAGISNTAAEDRFASATNGHAQQGPLRMNRVSQQKPKRARIASTSKKQTDVFRCDFRCQAYAKDYERQWPDGWDPRNLVDVSLAIIEDRNYRSARWIDVQALAYEAKETEKEPESQRAISTAEFNSMAGSGNDSVTFDSDRSAIHVS